MRPFADGTRNARSAVPLTTSSSPPTTQVLPAGTEILVGHPRLRLDRGRAPPGADHAAHDLEAATRPAGRPKTPEAAAEAARARPAPESRARSSGSAHRRLGAALAEGYVFPVYGPSSFADTFRAARAGVGWHHGEDIFAPLGAPLLAVADGTVFSVGWNDLGGYRLWLRDRQGNQFYYAHLSAFSPLAVDGNEVKAGDVLGFVGNTGDAQTTPTTSTSRSTPSGCSRSATTVSSTRTPT